MFELLFFLVLAAGVRGLVKQTKADLARWRGRPAPPPKSGRRVNTRSAGYWINQLAHGFPSLRHGFMGGWHDALDAHHQAREAIAEGRLRHAERKAATEPRVNDLRARRRAALEQLRRQRDMDLSHDEAITEDQARRSHPEWYARPCLHEGTLCRSPGHCSCRCANCELTDLERQREQQERVQQELDRQRQEAQERLAKQLQDQRDKDEAERKARESQQDPPDDDGQQDPDSTQPDEPAGRSTSEGDGTTVSETTVAGVEARMDQASTEAEQFRSDADSSAAYAEEHENAAAKAKSWASTTADQMQALKVDGATLGAMSIHLDALDEAQKAAAELTEALNRCKKAWAGVGETAGAVKGALKAGGHKDLEEAHQNAAGGGAEREFYGEGEGAAAEAITPFT